MLQRCYNSNRREYANYGGRGIRVCDRWIESFDNFLADIGPRPSPGHSIDRYPDNDGNYCPENCRWATWLEQQGNRRKAMYTYDGITLSAPGWARRLGITKEAVNIRLHVDPHRAFRTEIRKAPLTYNGQTASLTEWARRIGISWGTLRERIQKHGVEIALSMPKMSSGRKPLLIRRRIQNIGT